MSDGNSRNEKNDGGEHSIDQDVTQPPLPPIPTSQSQQDSTSEATYSNIGEAADAHEYIQPDTSISVANPKHFSVQHLPQEPVAHPKLIPFHHAKSAPDLFRNQQPPLNHGYSDESIDIPRKLLKPSFNDVNLMEPPIYSHENEAIYASAYDSTSQYEFSLMFPHSSYPIMPDEVTDIFAKSYNCVYQSIYYTLSFVLGAIAVLLFGIITAIISFSHVWILAPIYRLTETSIQLSSRVFKSCLNHLVSPLFESCGMCFSKIQVHRKEVRQNVLKNVNIA